jgi:gamma-glutamyl-gamma-aminobutyraldehyde dehydrogenase
VVDWHERAAAVRIDGRPLGEVARGRMADVDAAVRSARAAFADGRWAHKAPAARKRILQRFAEKILAAGDELALLETLDTGKPIQYSLSVDVPATARCIQWYGEAVDKIYDEIAATARRHRARQSVRRGRYHRALRRLQAERERPRQVAARVR